MKYRDVELLSAYLDGQLNPSDSARMESRLKTDPELAAVLDDLRLARGVLRKLPSRRAPRNFTLTPRMAGLKAPTPRVYPVLRYASVFAALLFFVSYAANFISPRMMVMSAPAYGVGGGGDGNESLATEAPPAAEKQSAATEAPFAAQDAAPMMETPTPAIRGVEPSESADQPKVRNEAPFISSWQAAFAASAIVLGVIAWFMRLMTERSFRRRLKS